tara:strand:- start:339 stop:668 length:330 start_codon:yes stop_codon:yes gene_type:complete
MKTNQNKFNAAKPFKIRYQARCTDYFEHTVEVSLDDIMDEFCNELTDAYGTEFTVEQAESWASEHGKYIQEHYCCDSGHPYRDGEYFTTTTHSDWEGLDAEIEQQEVAQ